MDQHNAKTIAAHHPDTVDIKAIDFIKDPTRGGLVQISGFKGQRKDLPDTIRAAISTCVMVTRNLDVEDGMVNGTFATIGHMVMVGQHDGEPVVRLLGLKLDNPSAGRKFCKKIQAAPHDLAYVERHEESGSKKGTLFPIKLAFACTCHKVQGMMVQTAVVGLKCVFEPGMSYVALSRTTSLQGLHITDFNENKVFADPRIPATLQTMTKVSFQTARPLLHQSKLPNQMAQTLTIVQHNTQGLPTHIEDLKCHHELRLADVLCITEMHLSQLDIPPAFQIEGYDVFSCSRRASYRHYGKRMEVKFQSTAKPTSK